MLEELKNLFELFSKTKTTSSIALFGFVLVLLYFIVKSFFGLVRFIKQVEEDKLVPYIKNSIKIYKASYIFWSIIANLILSSLFLYARFSPATVLYSLTSFSFIPLFYIWIFATLFRDNQELISELIKRQIHVHKVIYGTEPEQGTDLNSLKK